MKSTFEKRVLLFFVTGALLFAGSCRHTAKSEAPPSTPLSGEPEQYSATVVRIIEAGERREETMRIVVAGDKRREDWTEGGEPLALINRPDLGKSYLLDLRRKLYVETDLNQTPPAKNANATKSPTNSDNGDSSANPMTSESIEDNFEEAPTVIETRALPAETIAGERCAVTERRATFADGHHEVLKVFRAERLGGLAVKTEAETISQNHRVKITTERRDISLNISPEEFNIPADFKKVQSLERTRE